MYVGEQKLLKKLNLYFCATVDVAAGCWWYITWYPGSCKWSHVQTKGFIQHISITYSMKNKQKTDSDCIICPRQIYPPMFICISSINISEVSSGRKCVYLSVCFLLPMGLLSCYTLWMKGRVYSIIILKKCVFFQHLLGFVVFLLCLLNCQCTNTMLSHYWQRNSTPANWLLTHTKYEQINQASIKLSQQTFHSQEMINLWYEHRRTKKAWLNTEIECHVEIASHHRNEKDNWMTITSILQFAFSETNRKQEKWWFHIFRNIKNSSWWSIFASTLLLGPIFFLFHGCHIQIFSTNIEEAEIPVLPVTADSIDHNAMQPSDKL